jgi:hypothetical protein
MMKVYVVHRNRGGYAREDAAESDVVGVYTDQEVARKVALISYGRYEEMEVDYVFPGIKAAASEFGFSL